MGLGSSVTVLRRRDERRHLSRAPGHRVLARHGERPGQSPLRLADRLPPLRWRRQQPDDRLPAPRSDRPLPGRAGRDAHCPLGGPRRRPGVRKEPRIMNLGINLCFAVKRYLEPESWAQFVAEDLGLSTVQFTFDLLDPWWPERERDSLIQGVVKAADAFRLDIASAQVGLGHYLPGGLLDPSRDARAVAAAWWRRACDVAGALGASAIGGPLGTLSVADGASREARARRYDELLQAVTAITEHARAAGLRRLLIEPTPIARELPSTIYQSQ